MGDGPLILLVEDEPDLRATLMELLEGEGLLPTAVADLSTAVQEVADRGLPDLALIDFRLPDGLGSDLYSALRARGGRALILSAQPRPNGSEVPAHHWVSKGVTVRALIEIVRGALTDPADPPPAPVDDTQEIRNP